MTRKEVLAEMVKAFRQDFNDICQRVQDAPDGEVIVTRWEQFTGKQAERQD